MLNSDATKNNRGLLDELRRFVKASEAGDFNFSLDPDGLSDEEAEAVRLLKTALGKYRSFLEYDVMRYKLTCKSMGMVMWDMDVAYGDPLNPNNKITWSQELRHALGFSDENDFPNVFSSWLDRLHPEDKERAVDTCVEYILDRTSDEAYELEFRVMAKNGEYRHFRAFGATFRDSDGTPLRKAGSWLDITEQKQTEEQLKRRELMMGTLNEASVIFVSRNEDTFEENMTAGVTLIADIAGIDNITVYRNYKEAGVLHASQIYRWNREAGGTTKPTNIFTNTTYTRYVPSWEGIFMEGDTVNGPVRLMPETEAATLEAFGTLSAFAVPVFVNNVFWGFVLYEDCQKERHFESDCADMLRYAAFLL
ncbi:MAG: PAS domain-containing protein, partial [Synergistaceae bacterium]|nr:PAS domain-containing protein [Synergistaceae bacterium]